MSIETLLENLKDRGFTAEFCKPEEVKALVEKRIPKGETVGTGGSETLKELGLLAGLVADGYGVNNPSTCDKEYETICRENRNVNYYLTSTNALTEEGEFVNIDGRGNRIANMIYGVPNVIFVLGTNKIVPDIPAALKRIKEEACPPNARRLGKKTPCAYGKCGTCKNLAEKMCKATLILSHPCSATNVHVLIVDGSFGY